MEETLKKKVVYTNLFWSFCERFGAQFVSTVISIILARILVPEAYGIVAAVTIFTGIATTFVTGGFSSALIQKKNAEEVDYASMFFFNISFSIFLYAIIFATAPFLVRIFNTSYDYNLLAKTLRVAGVGIFFASLNSFYRAVLSKKLQFKKIFFISLTGSLSSGIAGIIMALNNFGVWALVLQTLGTYVVNFILFILFSGWRPKFMFSFKHLWPLVRFGSKLMLSSLITTLYMDVYGVVIGHEYDSETLAFYNKGNHFPKLIVANIVGAINAALFPIMAKMTTKEEYKRCVKKMNCLSCFFILPMVFGLAAVSTNFVSAVLTDKWLPCVIFLQIACFDYALQPIGLANLQCWKADGRGGLYLSADIIKKVFGVSFIAISLACGFGILGIAISALLTSFVSLLINLIPGKRVLNYSIWEQLMDVMPYFVLSLGMYLLVYGFDRVLPFKSVFNLIIEICIGIVAYIIGAYALRLPEYDWTKGLFKKIINKIKKKEGETKMNFETITKTNDTASRIRFIDIAKGVGIILVILMHTLQHDFNDSKLYIFLLAFTMPLFFMCSGFVSPFNKKTNIESKVKSLLIPTIFFLFLNVIIFIVCGLFEKNYYTLFKFGGFWFLIALFCCYLVNYLLDFIFENKKDMFKIVAQIVISVVLVSAGLYVSTKSNSFDAYYLNFFVAYPFLSIGQLARLIFDKINPDFWKRIYIRIIIGFASLGLLIVGFFFASYNIPVQMFKNEYGHPLLFIAFSLCGSIGIIGLCLSVWKLLPFEWIGKRSLIIMLTHFPINALSYLLLSKILSNSYVIFTLNFIIVVGVEIVVSFLLFRFVPILFGKIEPKVVQNEKGEK